MGCGNSASFKVFRKKYDKYGNSKIKNSIYSS
jgi:hypothetical protein